MPARRAGAAVVAIAAILALGTPALILAHRAPPPPEDRLVVSFPRDRGAVAPTLLASAPAIRVGQFDAIAMAARGLWRTPAPTPPPRLTQGLGQYLQAQLSDVAELLAPPPPAVSAIRVRRNEERVWQPSLEPCGGRYPPCWVAQRESGGSYAAFNAGGCGGNSCYGKWQFSGAWAGKLGLPDDLATATPAQQDEAAAQLWAGGAGCSHWAACG